MPFRDLIAKEADAKSGKKLGHYINGPWRVVPTEATEIACMS